MRDVAAEHAVSTAQIALAWLLHQPGASDVCPPEQSAGHIQILLAPQRPAQRSISSSTTLHRLCSPFTGVKLAHLALGLCRDELGKLTGIVRKIIAVTVQPPGNQEDHIVAIERTQFRNPR